MVSAKSRSEPFLPVGAEASVPESVTVPFLIFSFFTLTDGPVVLGTVTFLVALAPAVTSPASE